MCQPLWIQSHVRHNPGSLYFQLFTLIPLNSSSNFFSLIWMRWNCWWVALGLSWFGHRKMSASLADISLHGSAILQCSFCSVTPGAALSCLCNQVISAKGISSFLEWFPYPIAAFFVNSSSWILKRLSALPYLSHGDIAVDLGPQCLELPCPCPCPQVVNSIFCLWHSCSVGFVWRLASFWKWYWHS